MQQTTIKQTDTQQTKSHYEPNAISKIIFCQPLVTTADLSRLNYRAGDLCV